VVYHLVELNCSNVVYTVMFLLLMNMKMCFFVQFFLLIVFVVV